MPLFSGCQIPPPANWQDFESLCADLWGEEWRDRSVQRIGRVGQAQDGVDLCGRRRDGYWAGVQCKCIRADSVLSQKELESEIEKAKAFRPRLSQYIIATTGRKDATLEERCRCITDEHAKIGTFAVTVFGWDDICSLLARHPTIADRHYPFAITSVTPILLNNDSASSSADIQGIRFSFSREEFVHPRIAEELVGFLSDTHETVVSADVNSANRSNRFYGEVKIIPDTDGLWVEHEYEEPTTPNRPFFQYKEIGISGSGIHILQTIMSGGGTGRFNRLCFLAFNTDTGLVLDGGTLATRRRILLKTLGSIPIGDRYWGEIRFADSVLTVGPDQNSRGCLREGFSIRVE
jgi:hypothetical protein